MNLKILNAYFDFLVQLDRTEELIQNIEESDLKEKDSEIAELIIRKNNICAEIAKQKESVERFIDSIEDYYIHTIFRLRFQRGLPWKEIAGVVGGGNTEDGVKSVCYRYLKKLQRGDAS